MKIIHCSDIHLGKTLDGNPSRYGDYFRAFGHVADLAIENRVRCIVIAGDLFHRGNVDPSALADTVEILDRARRHSIDIIAIEGNHDYLDRTRNESWLLYLSRRGYITLLKPTEDSSAGTVAFEPFCREKGFGGFIEIDGVSFYGLGYWSSSVADQLKRAADSLPEGQEHVALLHAGVWDRGLMDLGRVTTVELRPLAKYFRYVALGHGHRPYEVTDDDGIPFAFNPGAPEIVNREEAKAPDASRGRVCLVDLSAEAPDVTYLYVPRRPYHLVTANIDGTSSPNEAMKIVEDAIEPIAPATNPDDEPVVILTLSGRVGFNPSALEPAPIEEMVRKAKNPLLVQIYNGASMVRNTGGPMGSPGDMERIYREAVAGMVDESPHAENRDEVVDLIYRIMDMGREESADSEEMLELIHRSRLALKGGRIDD